MMLQNHIPMQAQLDVFKKQMKQKRQSEEDDDITKLIKGGNIDVIPDLKDVKSKKNFYDNLAKDSGIPVSQTQEQSKDILQELKNMGPVRPQQEIQRQLRQDKQPLTQSATNSVLYNIEPQKRSTSAQQKVQMNENTYALNNKMLSLKYAELEGAIIKMQKQIEMIPVLQGRIYQQEKDFMILKSRLQDLEKKNAQFPFAGIEPQKAGDGYPRRSYSSQYARNSFHSEHSSPYRFGSDQYTQIIREQRELQKREESQQMQDYIQQIQRSSEASQNNISVNYPPQVSQKIQVRADNQVNEHNQPINKPETFQNAQPLHYNNQSYSYTNQPSSSQNYGDRQSPSFSGRARQRQVLRSSVSREESPHFPNSLNSPKQYERKLLDPQKINQMIAECNLQAQQLSRK